MDTYYRKHNVDRNYVYFNKAHAFGSITSITKYQLDNLVVTIDDPNHATAKFDKTWDTTLASGRSYSGSEEEQLKFGQLSGEWKITSEEELQVFNVTR